MWLGPSHSQAKDNEKNSGVDALLTHCGDAQKESDNKAFIPVFDPRQSVKSTKTVILGCYALPLLRTNAHILRLPFEL